MRFKVRIHPHALCDSITQGRREQNNIGVAVIGHTHRGSCKDNCAGTLHYFDAELEIARTWRQSNLWQVSRVQYWYIQKR